MKATENTEKDLSEGWAGPAHYPLVLAVTSGKGGVGKTNVVANLAVALSRMGKRVLIFDSDMGLGNVDLLLGLLPKYTLDHVLSGQKTLAEIMVHGPCGIRTLLSSSGVESLTAISPEQKLILLSELDRLQGQVDVLLIDTASGISSNVLYFSAAAQEIMVVASPEPASLNDAYAVMKVLSQRYGEKRFHLLVNQVRGEGEAQKVFRKLTRAADRFLDIVIDYAGYIPADDYLRMAVMEQRAVVEVFPLSRASRGFIRVAHRILQWPAAEGLKGNLHFFSRRLLMQDRGGPVPAPGREPGQ